MRAIVKKRGNSAAVRIPSGIMQAANLTLDAVVDVREQDGHIVIEPVRPGKVDLAGLLAGITPENLQGGVDFGEPVGRELRRNPPSWPACARKSSRCSAADHP